MFFLVLLQKLVFTEGAPPHSEIIKQLMNLVIHKNLTSKKLNILFGKTELKNVEVTSICIKHS